MTQRRIKFIDGLRGVSILFVIFHHAFGAWHVMFHTLPNWKEHELFGESITMFPPVAYGYLAVWLFFFISGFVIFISLENRSGFWNFMGHRWLRLFPAMLICSVLVLGTASLFPERPLGQPHLIDALPGLTFIEPGYWGSHYGLEGSFWSLYVEMRFYIIFGASFFLFGSKNALRVLVGLFCVGLYFRYYNHLLLFPHMPGAPYVAVKSLTAVDWLGKHGLGMIVNDTLDYGMFAGGALFAKYYENGDRRLLYLAAALMFATACALGWTDAYRGGALKLPTLISAFVLMFVIPLSCLSINMQKFYANRLFVFFGFVSYPLYLIHQNMLVAIIIKLHRALPAFPVLVVPFVPMAGIIAVAWLIAKYLEPKLRRYIERGWQSASKIFWPKPA